jgi:hypothetical protein
LAAGTGSAVTVPVEARIVESTLVAIVAGRADGKYRPAAAGGRIALRADALLLGTYFFLMLAANGHTARVDGAAVPVVAISRWEGASSSGRLAHVLSAGVAIVAVREGNGVWNALAGLRMADLAAVAGVAVVAILGCGRAAHAVLAEVVGAGDAVIADHVGVDTRAALAAVGCAEVVVVAIHRREHALARCGIAETGSRTRV